jgi:ankyrin repeat protein
MLCKAVYYDHVDIIKYLVENGADVNKRGKAQSTPLHFVCHHYTSIENMKPIIKMLIEHGADLNAKDIGDKTPLMVLLEETRMITRLSKEEFNVIKYLVENGADVNYINSYGKKASDYTTCNYVHEYLTYKENE